MMRILAYMKKTLLETLREWKILSVALLFAPVFIYIMYGYFNAASPAYRLLVADHDLVGNPGEASRGDSKDLIHAWRAAKHPNGKPVFNVVEVSDLEGARAEVRNRDADLLVEIPEGFAATLLAHRGRDDGTPALLVNHADDRSLRGFMAMTLSDYIAFSYATEVTGATIPLDVSLRSLGAHGPADEFDLYVPSLLVLAIIMILFTAATSLVKEVDKGTMIRLMLTKLRTSELLAAVAIDQVLLGLAALLLTYLAAVSCGYESKGSMIALLVVGAVTTLGVVAIAVLVSAFLKSMFELLTVGTFPFFILMFFSECMFPLPKIKMFQIGGNIVNANDVLPTTLGVRAFNKILSFDAGLEEIAFELCAIVALTIGYFAIGIWLFHRRHQHI